MSESPLSLNKIIPNYFNKWVFRGVLAIILLLFLFTAWSNGWRNNFVYAECPINALNSCELNKELITNNEYFPDEWDGVVLSPGEFIGEKPNKHYFLFKTRVFLLIVLSFIINHGYYWVRTGKFKPEINKKQIKKLLEEKE